MILDNINSPSDVKKLNREERVELATEIREHLIKKVSIHGGHCGPNLGMVEATIALHTVFNSPIDKIVFDVSHQSYPHKMLTGRKYGFTDVERYDSVSGYSNPAESEHDFFELGHTSTSISLACGLVKARDLKGEKGNVIAVIGDGSLSGGEALEGLNVAGELGTNFIIVVNDNNMSIAENHGGMYKNLKELRETKGKASTNLFTAMGLNYIFVEKGNDIDALIDAFTAVKDSVSPVVVHIVTEKGKGYKLAEENKEEWHWHVPFDIETGESKFKPTGEDYGTLTADYLLDEMKKDKSVFAITAGTPTVFGFTKDKRELAGKQFVDVGIAEETAVALASGAAKAGAKPVFGVYSTFMQRTYDQIAQDVCINKNPITMVVFAASVWGMNDVTHIGMYDIPMISNIPELVYLAPTCKEEYMDMLKWSVHQDKYPVAIRVPSNGVISTGNEYTTDYSDINKFEVTRLGEQVAVIAVGDFYQLGEKICDNLEKQGLKPTLINPRYVSGIDKLLLEGIHNDHEVVITLEDGMLEGGFGQKIASYYGYSDMKVKNYGFEKEFPDRYVPDELMKENGLTVENITEDVLKMINK